jgi:hypothetical protein
MVGAAPVLAGFVAAAAANVGADVAAADELLVEL